MKRCASPEGCGDGSPGELVTAQRLAPLVSVETEPVGGASGRREGWAGLSAHDLTRRADEHIAVAGLTRWPKIYQAMRSSCENDWKQAAVAERR